MAYYLVEPSHYLNQCWFIISKVMWHSFEGITKEDLKITISKTQLKFAISKSWPEHPATNELTHWGRVTQICISKLTIIGSDNGLSPGWHQVIIWNNAGILLIGALGTSLSKILIKNQYIFIQENVFENDVWKMAAILSWHKCVKTCMWNLLHLHN